MEDFNLEKRNKITPKSKPKKQVPIRKPLGNLIKSLITISILSLVIYALTFLPAHLKQAVKPGYISITGNDVLTTETILNYLPIYKKTLWIDIDSFELSRYLVSHPWIQKATIHRKANLGIDIHIVEVTPLSFLKTQNSLYLLSHDLRILNLERTGKGWNLPVVVNNNVKDLKPGEYVSKATFKKANEIITLLKGHSILPLKVISEIDITDPLNIQLITMPNAVRIKLGSNNFEEKMLNLNDALKQLEKEGDNIRYIDLRYKRAVVFRRKV